MITDKNSFKIVKILPNQIICSLNKDKKFIFKEYQNSSFILNRFSTLQTIKHHSLLNVHSLKVEETIGVYFQHYSGSLHKYTPSSSQLFSQLEIMNTFNDIIDAIEYLLSQNLPMYVPSLNNIVITENQQIKYIDHLLLVENLQEKSPAKVHEIYQGISSIIFQLVFPKKHSQVRSWKNRLKILKKTLSQKSYSYFLSIFNKSLLLTADPSKTKKIKKKDIIHQGKQNKISQ